VAEEQRPRAEELVRRAEREGVRVELGGPEHGTLGARVRAARLVPYQAVIGEREAAGPAGLDGLVALRLRDGRRPGPLTGAQLLHRILTCRAARGPVLWETSR